MFSKLSFESHQQFLDFLEENGKKKKLLLEAKIDWRQNKLNCKQSLSKFENSKFLRVKFTQLD